MRIAILGTGGIGLATAAWLSHYGHEPVLWSPSGNGTRELAVPGSQLHYSGVIEGKCNPSLADHISEALAGTDAVIIAAPGNAHRHIMRAMAPHLLDGQTVIINSVCSLSALYLSKLLAERGVRAAIATWGTTVLTARRISGTEVKIMTARSSLHVATLPVSKKDEGLKICQSLFGDRFAEQTNVLATSLININPIAHLGLALCNVTRIERQESWPQYHYMTEGVSRLIMGLEQERLALAKAFGLEIHGIEEHFQRSFDVPPMPLKDIAATLHAKRGGPPGPTSMDTRYITEDAPFGLVFCEALAKTVDVDVPLHSSAINLASLIWGINLRAQNDLLGELTLEKLGKDKLQEFILDGWQP